MDFDTMARLVAAKMATIHTFKKLINGFKASLEQLGVEAKVDANIEVISIDLDTFESEERRRKMGGGN